MKAGQYDALLPFKSTELSIYPYFFPLLHKFHFRQLPIIGNITKCLSHEYPMFFVSVHITSLDEAAL